MFFLLESPPGPCPRRNASLFLLALKLASFVFSTVAPFAKLQRLLAFHPSIRTPTIRSYPIIASCLIILLQRCICFGWTLMRDAQFDFRIKNKRHTRLCMSFVLETGIYISSQAVSSQVLSAQLSLTSVFGMRTGGTSASLTPVMDEGRCAFALRTFTTA